MDLQLLVAQRGTLLFGHIVSSDTTIVSAVPYGINLLQRPQIALIRFSAKQERKKTTIKRNRKLDSQFIKDLLDLDSKVLSNFLFLKLNWRTWKRFSALVRTLYKIT